MLTRSMLPTKPMSSPPGAVRRATRKSEPSSPHRPTAGWPWRFKRSTISLFTFPIKTIFATSTVSSSDTRRPPTNSIGSPRRCMYALISGPPPCTTIGFRPTYFSSTTSRANSSRSAASSIAAPPYLITTVLPWNSLMYGSASSSVPTSRIGEPLGSVFETAPMSAQGKPGKDAGSVACYARERPRTQIQRRHARSCRVLGVYSHVLMAEIGEEHLGLGALAGQADLVFELGALHGSPERLLV